MDEELLKEKFDNLNAKMDDQKILQEKILEAIHGKDGLASKTTKNTAHLFYIKWLVGILIVAVIGGKII